MIQDELLHGITAKNPNWYNEPWIIKIKPNRTKGFFYKAWVTNQIHAINTPKSFESTLPESYRAELNKFFETPDKEDR